MYVNCLLCMLESPSRLMVPALAGSFPVTDVPVPAIYCQVSVTDVPVADRFVPVTAINGQIEEKFSQVEENLSY